MRRSVRLGNKSAGLVYLYFDLKMYISCIKRRLGSATQGPKEATMKFEFHNPMRLIFGAGVLARLGEVVREADIVEVLRSVL